MASAATLERLCAEFDSPPDHIAAAVGMLEQQATPAFLTRYRRHDLGNMPEERLMALAERLHVLTELEQRRATILQQAEERGRRTPELEATLADTADQDLLDDYYQSMRPRRRGIAMQMEEKGLMPLALAIQHRQFGDAAIESLVTPRREQPARKRPEPVAPAAGDASTAADAPTDAATAATGSDDAGSDPAGGEVAGVKSNDDASTGLATTDASDASEVKPEQDATTAPADGETESADETSKAATQGQPDDAAGGDAAGDDAAGDDAAGETSPAAPAAAADDATEEVTAEHTTEVTTDEPFDALDAQMMQAEAPAEARLVPDVALQRLAEPYLSEQHGITTPEAALEGALLILADKIAHEPTTRARFRDELRRGILRAKPVNPDGDAGKARQFFDFAEPINRIPAGRMLALRRAEREKILRLELTLPEGRHRKLLRELHASDTVPGSQLGDFYDLVFDNAAAKLQDLCGKDVRRRLKEKADREAMRTYSRNLRSQLLSPPLGHKKVLSLRGSGKAIWAVLLNEDGSVGEHKTLPTDNDEQKQGAMALLVEWIQTHQPAAIAIPHGRRQAGSEKIIAALREALGESPLPMVVPVDEAASTIFATSTTGKKAIPGVEVGARTAISLGRRLQDPLLELARMEVRTLGLGHTVDDVHQGTLHRELHQIKSACLAQVGCDLNTADRELLEMLPGLSHEQAQAIVAHRKQHGGFANREALRQVDGIDEATWRNVAPFLRILGGEEPLDASPVHPDDYAIVRAIAAQKGCEPMDLFGKNLRDVDANALVTDEWPKPRLVTVLLMLERGLDDGRGELIATANAGVNTIADLHADRQLKGRVASLTEFGAFIDLGIGQDGLVHISQIPGHRLRDADQMLRVGEVVDVWVLSVDQQKQKISLSMHRPRHLAEGRLPTLGERMDQQQGRRRSGGGRSGPREPRAPAAEGRRPGSGGGRPGFRRGPGEGGREGGRDGGREGGRDGGRDGGRGFGGGDRGPRRDRDERGPRGGGSREQRVYTVESAREIEDKRTHKGEVTSLSSLRNLLAKADDGADRGSDQRG